MIVRRCSGGVVFYANKVLIVENDKGEWTLPKGKIVGDGLPHESAVERVKLETGVDAKILDIAGDTIYEFFSRSRNQRVCNAIMWYVMESKNSQVDLSKEFLQGNFYKIPEALEKLSHSKEKSLVDVSYKKYKEFKKTDERKLDEKKSV
ncbi:NUDIX domain-containing protein [Peptostreptococcus equinus]|uniref:NUDIX domain-containing protein n=1 Tax=Peptostreptococcus equinus TaxID=3003601 RepID=A0ABY7JRX3_9FIRM|nr:NUDIX domain-containing protein [Peptostreptococcus sp. CBA3647]WAW15224.1 NUDIX domain-containing protein [Peptostreptococcus sp. CBA3647]